MLLPKQPGFEPAGRDAEGALDAIIARVVQISIPKFSSVVRPRLPHRGRPRRFGSIAWLRRRKAISVSSDQRPKVWDMETGRVLRTLEATPIGSMPWPARPFLRLIGIRGPGSVGRACIEATD